MDEKRVIMKYSDDDDIGYILEVDLDYPKRPTWLHKGYPLAPEIMSPRFHLMQDPLVGHAPGPRSGETQCIRKWWVSTAQQNTKMQRTGEPKMIWYNRIESCYPMVSKLLQIAYFF